MTESITIESIYRTDPILRFLRDKLELTPNKILALAFGFAGLDLVIASLSELIYSRDGIIGALNDPPYLITMLVMIPLFLRTYVWMPEGLWNVYEGMSKRHLILDKDMQKYDDNMTGIIDGFDKKWVWTALGVALVFQILVVWGNLLAPPTFNTYLSVRLFLLRIPLGYLALYGAVSVTLRSVLILDWRSLIEEIEPEVNPQFPDRAAGYGVFTKYIVGLLGIFTGLLIFLFTKILFQANLEVHGYVFQPVYDIKILFALLLAFVIGFLIFLYVPTGAARKAMKAAKQRQLEIIAEVYQKENKDAMELIQRGLPEGDSELGGLWIKGHLERMKQLRDVRELVEALPESPINREALGRFGLSYLSVPISSFFINLLQFALSGKAAVLSLQTLFSEGSFSEIIRGIIQLIFSGEILTK